VTHGVPSKRVGGAVAQRSNGALAMRPPRVALGKYPALLLDVLARALSEEGLDICAQAVNAEALIAGASRLEEPPAVVMVDSSLIPEDPRLRFVGRLRREFPNTRIVVLVEDPTPELAQATLEQAVDGVVLAHDYADALALALQRVADGQSVFPIGWLALVRRAGHTSLFNRLSARQMQVLELIAQGLSNRQIADRLVVSQNTVKFHVREIYTRLGVVNRVQAAEIHHRVATRG